jgi:hypothetical protein
MGLDYRSFFKPANPPTKDVWLVIGVDTHPQGSGKTFTFIDSQTKPRDSENLHAVCCFLDDLLKHEYVILVRQDRAHKKGWLRRYQEKP